jgi:pimeloyl-ACP methyl ester carboxylesterase
MDAGLPLDPRIMINYVPSIVDRLKKYFEECKNDPGCNAAYPDLEERFLNLLKRLNNQPVELILNDPVSGEEVKYVLNGYRLSSYLFFSMFYSTQIPFLIGKVLEGDYSDIKNSVAYGLAPNYFADGLGFTIFISEAGEYGPSDIDLDPKYNVFTDGVMRTGLGGRFLLEVNEAWDITKLNPEQLSFREPSEVPVLVLNGIYDPVIPVKYDKVLKKNLKNAHIFRFDGVPHSAFDNATECVLPMLMEFLQDPTKAPDSSCMGNYKQVYQLKTSE